MWEGEREGKDREGRLLILLRSIRLRSRRDLSSLETHRIAPEEKSWVNLLKNSKFNTKILSKRQETKTQIQV